MATTTNHIESQPQSNIHLGASRELLERISASSHLRRAPRLQELLHYLGERSLKGGCERLQEHEIGSHVFRRPESYDTSADNIVRTSVSDLRRRIEAYFHSEGAHEPLLMEIPRGSYIPVFRNRTIEAEARAKLPADLQIAHIDVSNPAVEEREIAVRQSWMPAALASTCVLAALLLGVSIYFWNQYRDLQQLLFTSQSKPALASFWSPFLGSNANTDLVISDTGIGLAEALTHKTFSLNNYFNRSYISQLETAEVSPDMHASLNKILTWNLANPDEFTLARRILALDPAGRYVHLYNARNYTPDLIKRDNVILVGARKSNPWDEIFDSRLNFIPDSDNPRIINRVPISGEQSIYDSSSVAYCVIAYMPKPDQSGIALLIEGTSAEATEAAGDFLLSNEQLSGFKKRLHVAVLPFFEVLLKVSAVRGTPLSDEVVAYRTYPNSR